MSIPNRQPHRATMGHLPVPMPTSSHQSNLRFEMNPPQSPFPETRPLTSLPILRAHLPSDPEIPLDEEGRPVNQRITLRTPASQGELTLSGQDGSPAGTAGPVLPCPRPGPTRENGSSLTSGSSARSSLPWNTACPDTKAPAGKAARGATIDTVQATVLLNQTGWTELHSNRSQRKRTAPSSP